MKKRRILAIITAMIMLAAMLPVSAFAEDEAPATGTDVAIESVTDDEKSTTEEAGSPGDPGEQSGSDEDKTLPAPSINGQETPSVAPQEEPFAAPHTHEFGTEWKSDDAKHWHECTADDGEKSDEETHAFADWTITKEATETEAGSRERVCSVCGYAETETIPATGVTKQRTLLGASGGVDINEVNFPDDNFREFVKEYDEDNDGALSATELVAITRMDCSEKGIASLKGIEHFTALKVVDCYKNQLTELDVSKNTALEQLWCDYNQLTSLDVSKNTALKDLYCDGNRLTTLDVSKNTALEQLYCYSNQLTTLDVSKNTALKQLYCYSNQLTTLDVSKNTTLTYLDCYNNQLTTLDVSKNTALKDLYCDGNQLTTLDVSKVPAIKDAVVNGDKDASDSDYDFYSSSQGKLYVDKTVTLITEETELTTYTVTVSASPAEGGTVTGGGTVTEGQNATVTATANAGYAFDGWYDGDIKVSGQTSYTFTVSGARNLTARFKKSVDFNYDIIGDTFDLGEEIYIRLFGLRSGDEYLFLEELEKTTLTWNGATVDWWADPHYEGIVIDSNDLGLGTHTLTLNYPGNDEYFPASADISITVVKKLALSLEDFAPATALVNTPYTVSGRIVDENGDPYSGKPVWLLVQRGENSAAFISLGSVTTDQNGAFSKEVSVELPTAPGTRQIWIRAVGDDTYKDLDERPVVTFVDQLPTYTVTFKDGDTVLSTQTVENGAKATRPDPAPTKEGHVFKGWYKDESCSNNYWFNEPITADTTVYAKFVPITTITKLTIPDYPAEYLPKGGEKLEFFSFAITGNESIEVYYLGIEDRWEKENGTVVAKTNTYPMTVADYDTVYVRVCPILLDDGFIFADSITLDSSALPAGASASVARTSDTEAVLSITMPKTGPAPDGTKYTVTVAAKPAEGGVVSGGGQVTAGVSATVTATANEGYVFGAWWDDADNYVTSANPYTIASVTGNMNLTAKFLKDPPASTTYSVTVEADPAEGGTVTGGGTVADGQETTVTATANEGYIFDGWYDGETKVSDDASYTFTVTDGITLQAKFKKITQLLNHNKVAVPDQEVGVGRTSATTFGVWADGGSVQLDYERIKDRISILLDGTAVSTNPRFDGTSGSTMDYTGSRIFLMCSGAELGPVGSEHIVEVKYEGDDTYAPCSVRYKLEVVAIRKLHVAEFSPTIAEVNKPFTISGRILDENDQPAVDQYVQVLPKIGRGYYVFSDQDGRFSVVVDENIPSEHGQTMLVDVFVESNLYEELWEKNYSITFSDRHDVTVEAEPAEGGTVTGGGGYLTGESATLVATATEGYEFDGWWDGENNVSWYEEYTIPEVTGDINLTAKFVKLWTVTMDMNGGTIDGAESSTMDFRDGHVDQLPTVEDMAEWIADGSWITGPENSGYIGAEITDVNGTKTYKPGDAYTVVSDATIKVLWKSTVTPPSPTKITYTVTGGADSTWTKDSNATVTITVKRSEDDANCIKHFTGVQIDGKTLVKDTDYTATSGSTVVTLKPSALQKLTVGSHTVTVNFDDGSAEANLTVKAKPKDDTKTDTDDNTNTDTGANRNTRTTNTTTTSTSGGKTTTAPKTGDESNAMLWFLLISVSMGALLLIGSRRKLMK